MKRPMDRFMSRFSKMESGCWKWIAALNSNGYGVFWVGQKCTLAHRFSYESFTGTILAGNVIHHLCSNRWCVNPEHLAQTSNRENLLLGDTIARRNSQKTHCPQGHEFSSENTFVNRRGERQCKQCRRSR